MSEHNQFQQPGHQPPPPPSYGGPTPPPPLPPSPPAGYGQPYGAPQPDTKRRWPMIVGGIILTMLLFIGGCSFLLYRFTRGPIDAANDFLADVSAQDFDAAFDHLEPSCFHEEQRSPAALGAFFGDSVTSYNLTQVSNDNNSSGSASGTITRSGFGEQSITVQMTNAGDEWLVCGFRID